MKSLRLSLLLAILLTVTHKCMLPGTFISLKIIFIYFN